MSKDNYIDEEYLLLERPNIREEVGIASDEDMDKYLKMYNAYNNLLIPYIGKKYFLIDAERELDEYKDDFIPVASEDKDLYQHAAEGYLKYYYLRNNIYVERLSTEDKNYLLSLDDYTLTKEKEEFIERTYLDVILENNNMMGMNVNYGPNSAQYYKPSDAIIIGVRYNQFKNLKEENAINLFATTIGKLQILNGFLEYKVRNYLNESFYIIIYDEYSVKCKKKDSLNK